MYLVTPRIELIKLLKFNKSETVKMVGDELFKATEIVAGRNHFYFNATCINTSSEGWQKIAKAGSDYLKLSYLAYLFDDLFFGNDDYLSDIFGDVKLSVDLFDTYWNLYSPWIEINTDSYDEIMVSKKDKFSFPEDDCFKMFLSRLGLVADENNEVS